MIDLHQLGKRHGFKPSWDESREGLSRDLWAMTLAGKHGHIYVQSEDQLAFSTSVRRAASLMVEIPGCVLIQEGNDGWNVLFPTEYLERVGEALKVRRKRRLSPEQKAEMAARLAKYNKRSNQPP